MGVGSGEQRGHAPSGFSYMAFFSLFFAIFQFYFCYYLVCFSVGLPGRGLIVLFFGLFLLFLVFFSVTPTPLKNFLPTPLIFCNIATFENVDFV